MPKKLTYEEAKHFIEVESGSGCKLISKEYVNSCTLLNIKCKCGNEFTVSYNTFQRGKRQCNKCTKINIHNKNFPQEKVDKIIKLYNSGYKLKEIAKMVGTKSDTASKILKENNIQIKKTQDYYSRKELSHRKYTFNEDYFENIDDGNKAYWLGFLYADGNVSIRRNKNGNSKGGRVELTLQKDDEYHLYNFIKCLKGNILVRERDVKLNGKIYKASRIDLNSIKTTNDLIKQGCVERKSLILKFPYHLDNKILSHFLRGYIDGDGSIVFNTYELADTFCVSLLGTQEFLKGVKEELESNNIKCSNIKNEKQKVYTLYIYGRDNLRDLFNYLYKDAEIFLGRKYEKYIQALTYFEKDFNINPVARLFIPLDDELQKKIYHKNIVRPELRKSNKKVV